MVDEARTEGRSNHWLEASGLVSILRTLGLAIHPAKLGIALASLFLTIVLGGALDWIWVRAGGVDPSAITRFVSAREQNQAHSEPAGSSGVFDVWLTHERQCVLGFLGSSLPGASLAAGTRLGSYVEAYSNSSPLRNLSGMGQGALWMVLYHPLYALLFGLGSLLIWAWGGGAICRIAAVQFAHDDKLTIQQGIAYAKGKWVGGFVLAPCIPLAFMAITAALMIGGGMLLRLPIFGDLVCGLGFGLAILGGFVVTVLVMGLLLGGSLLWPTVAAEGSDAFDSFSRSFSYPFSKPWKFALYAILSVVYASICWALVSFLAYVALRVTRGIVGFGTMPFGWWNRGDEGTVIRKLDLLWPIGGPHALFAWPDWSRLAWYEYVSALPIALYVLLLIGLVWAFLISFYFSASTVVYFLMRRDVDGTDLDEVHVEPEAGLPPEATVQAAVPATTPT